MFLEFIELIRGKFAKGELPGTEAHRKLAPQNAEKSRFDYSSITDYRESGVLILLFPKDDKPFIPLIKRPEYEGIHSGQISLPGGKKEDFDESLIQTALREANEEIGVDAGSIHILGGLTPLYIPPSKFMVSPFVGYVETQPHFIPDPTEVQRIFETPIEYFLKSSNLLNKEMEIVRRTGKTNKVVRLETPYFDLEGEVLWGATAMILSELKEIVSAKD